MKIAFDVDVIKDLGITRMVHQVAEWGYKYIEQSPHPQINPFYKHPRASREIMAEYKQALRDTGHAWYSEGGEAPMLAILKKYLPRINHVHLKDVRPPVIDQVRRDGLSFLDGVKKGTFTVPGDGVIDFRPVFKLLDDFGYKGWMVVEAEQDPALANPFEYAVKARKYIRETAGI